MLLTVPVLLGVATLMFLLRHLVPGDPAASRLGEGGRASEVAGAGIALVVIGFNLPGDGLRDWRSPDLRLRTPC